MKFGSLFSGIGGLDLGLERAGMTCAWQVENDEFCNRVLNKHWPDVSKYGDIRDVEDLPPVDLICGGFPCPPVSLAASHHRKFEGDERWLWNEYFRIICKVKPKWILVENVPGLLSARDGRLFAGILIDLAKVRYDAEWKVLSAKEFGAPHKRDRLFLVAYTNEERLDAPKIFSRVSPNSLQQWINGEPKFYFDGAKRTFIGIPKSLRMDDGFSSEVDRVGERIGSLGNAVVPQVAEWIGRRIVEFDREARKRVTRPEI